MKSAGVASKAAKVKGGTLVIKGGSGKGKMLTTALKSTFGPYIASLKKMAMQSSFVKFSSKIFKEVGENATKFLNFMKEAVKYTDTQIQNFYHKIFGSGKLYGRVLDYLNGITEYLYVMGINNPILALNVPLEMFAARFLKKVV